MMRYCTLTVALCLGGLAISGLGAQALYAHGRDSSDLKFETSDFMQRTAYRNVDKLDRDDAPGGAYGKVNRAWDKTHLGKWYIELQRNGGDLVDGGVATHNASAIARGLRIIQWGFDQQQSDGSFDCPDAFHSTSFFVESTAHALLLLQAAGNARPFASQVDAIKPALHKAALWMVQPDVEATGRVKNAPFTHRRYLVGAALGETGMLCHDQSLIAHSEDYVREGISLQDPSGYNPEKGGYDSSYHAVGLWYAERYYSYVAQEPLRHSLFEMLRKAVAWEASRISSDDQVITTGNTRVGGPEPERDRAGKAKTPAVGQVFRAFAYWSVLSDDHSYMTLAQKVARAAHMSDDSRS